MVTDGAELVCGDPVAHAGPGLADRRLSLVCGAGTRPLAGRSGSHSRQGLVSSASRPMMRDVSKLSQSMITRYLAVFLLLNAFVFNGCLWLVSPEPYKETVLQHSYDVLRGRGCDDSWWIMSLSLQYLREHPDKPLYSEIFFERKLKLQYPPSSL